MRRPRFINGCSKSVSLAQEFEALGWDAWTCDILPSEGWRKHIQDDILKHLNDGWDFGIFHTDCTYLANSGVRWRVERAEWKEIKESCDFFNAVDSGANFAHVMENPIQHKYAREYIRVYDQMIQPWNFGVLESKAICLWLCGVPELVLPITKKPEGVKQSVWREAPGPDRKANRARNFPAISKAMAEQWGRL
jgi:hypothetical protein